MSLADHTRAASRIAAGGSPDAMARTGGSLIDRFLFAVERFGDNVAVCDLDRSLTYCELDALSDVIAANLADASKRIALLVSPSVDTIATMLAILKAGRTFVALDPTHPTDRVRYCIDDASAGTVIFDRANEFAADEVRADGATHIEIHELQRERAGQSPAALPTADDAAYIVYTSGSTGNPKGVICLHKGTGHFANSLATASGLGPNDRVSMVFSLGFGASMLDIFTAFSRGASLHLYDIRRDGMEGIGAWVDSQQISVFHAVPSIFRSLAASDQNAALASIRVVDLGGEPLRWSDVELFRRRFPDTAVLMGHLACTEAAVIAQYNIDIEHPKIDHALPAGVVGPGVRVVILDDDNNEAATGEVGQIVLVSEFLSAGYWDAPDLTAASFEIHADGSRRYRTGDLGRLDHEGVLHCLGRASMSWAKVRGNSVELAEVEEALASVDGVVACAVAKWPDPAAPDASSDRLAGYAVVAGAGSTDVEMIRSALSARLPSFMVPAHIAVLDELPTTPTGKLDRRALPAPTTARPDLATPYVAPATATEVDVAAVWQAILDIDAVGLDDDFFALGGDSLRAVRTVAAIEERCDRSVPASMLLTASTIRTLSAAIESPTEPNTNRRDLIELSPGGAGNPLVLLPGAGGTIFSMRPMAQALGTNRPVVGFHYPGLDGAEHPIKTVEAIAERFADQIVDRFPEGGISLCGYSFGGLVAWELVRCLQARNRSVVDLTLLDTRSPVRVPLSLKDRLLLHAKIRLGIEPVQVDRGPTVAEVHRGDNLSDAMLLVHATCGAATEQYVPFPQELRVTLVQCPSVGWQRWSGSDGVNGWQSTSPRGIDIHTIDVDHLLLFMPEHHAELMTILAPILA